MPMKLLALAGGLLLASAGAASAAPGHTTTDLNLRSGPGTSYGIVDTMPEGARVNIRSCAGSWCRVDFHGTMGYAAENLLSGTRNTYAYRTYRSRYAYAPSYAYVARPSYGGGYGWGPGYAADDDYGYGSDLGYAYQPGISFGFGFGPGWGGDWDGD